MTLRQFAFDPLRFSVENCRTLGCAAGEKATDDRNVDTQSAQHADGHRIADLFTRVVAITRALVDVRRTQQRLLVIVTQRFDRQAAGAGEPPDRHHGGGGNSG
jgi:hypothetical protein